MTAALSHGFHRRLQAGNDPAAGEAMLRRAIDDLLGDPVQIVVVSDEQLRDSARMALRYSRSTWDMLYLRLAQELDCQWCTADEKVLAPTRADFPRERVLLLRDLPTSKILA